MTDEDRRLGHPSGSCTTEHKDSARAARSVSEGHAAAEATHNQIHNSHRENLPQVIFFGNGPLADYTLEILKQHCEVIFHVRTKEDLSRAVELKQTHPDAFGILASFGTIIKSDVLELFEPEGILNLHPSKLPAYRGASPIESAILAGDTDFSYSIMKLVKAMDAGPIYHQATLKQLPLNKVEIYRELAIAGTDWLVQNLTKIRTMTPQPQDDTKATFTKKLDKSDSYLHPESHSAPELYRQIIAFQGFPKPKYDFYNKTCIILDAHIIDTTSIICDAASSEDLKNSPLLIKCADHNYIAVDRLQPEGKKPMDAKSFLNGYAKKA